MSEDKVRLGLVGLSKQGREHLEAAAACSSACFVAGCDSDEAIRAGCSAAFPQLSCHAGIASMLQAEPVEGLVLALPHHVYAEIWPEVTASGLPVLKEKPLGRTLREALTFLDLGSRPGVHLRTGIQRRRHPSYARLKQELSGSDVRAVEAVLHLGFNPDERPRGWRGEPAKAGGGALLDCGYHMIDLAVFLVGPFEVVSANLWFLGRPAVPEMLETEANLLGRAGKAWVRVESRVGGERKKEEVRVATAGEVYRADRESVWRDGVEVFRGPVTWAQALAAQLDAFAEDIRRGRFDEPEVWEQGPVMRIIENVYALARQVGPFRGGYESG
jgi:predicted dehydrogenase